MEQFQQQPAVGLDQPFLDLVTETDKSGVLEYEAPVIEVLGSLDELTGGGGAFYIDSGWFQGGGCGGCCGGSCC